MDPLLAATLAGALAAAAPSAASDSPRWEWPVGGGVPPPVAHEYRAPAERWSAGHRGIDLEAPAGSAVRAVESGVVTHQGRIAGRGTVTLRHPDGLHSTYEPVESTVQPGDTVQVGEVIGTLTREHGHCLPVTCLHVGARHGDGQGDGYRDPRPLFGAQRVILLPMTP